MVFKHYSDEVKLNKGKLDDNFRIGELDKLIVSTRKTLKSMKIDTQNKYVFYKRNTKGESILGIQLISGDMEDISNYIVFDHKMYQLGELSGCSCDMHTDAKASQKGNEFATYSVDSITSFFTDIEKGLIESKQITKDYDCMKSLDSKSGKENPFAKIFRRRG
jgi:hypothetical protein